MTSLRSWGLLALLWPAFSGAAAPRDEKGLPAPIPVEQFKNLHELIKPHPGELRWREIPWLTNIQEAREKASAQDKPILLWLAADGNPIGRC